MVDKDKILYIQVSHRRIVIHTTDEAYIGSLTRQLEVILKNFGFERSDSNKFVHMDKILLKDKKLRRVYFNAERTKFCPVTRPNIKKFFW